MSVSSLLASQLDVRPSQHDCPHADTLTAIILDHLDEHVSFPQSETVQQENFLAQ